MQNQNGVPATVSMEQMMGMFANLIATNNQIQEQNKMNLELLKENQKLKDNNAQEAQSLNYLKIISQEQGDKKMIDVEVDGVVTKVHKGFLGIEASNGDRFYRLVMASAKLMNVLDAEGNVKKTWVINEDRKRTVLAWSRQISVGEKKSFQPDLLFSTCDEIIRTGNPVVGFIKEVAVVPYTIGDNDNITKVNVAVLNHQEGTDEATQNVYQQLYSQKVHNDFLPHVINEENAFQYGYLIFCAKKAGLSIRESSDASGQTKLIAVGQLTTARGFATTEEDMKGLCESLNKKYGWDVFNVEPTGGEDGGEEDGTGTKSSKKRGVVTK